MKFLKLFTLLISLSLFSFAQDQKVWDEKTLEEANTAKDENYLTEEEKKVVFYINLVRLNPELFGSTYLKTYLDTSRFQKKSKWTSSIQKELKSQKSLSVLYSAKDLFHEAENHSEDMGKKGKIGHNSSSGKSFKNRLKDFVKTYKSVGENCDYGNAQALNIVMSLLIDEGIENLGHRKNILHSDYRFIGVAIREHKKFRYNCVMDFGGEKL
jgi:hypothetical protein